MAYESFRMVGGPLDGQSIEIAHEDVMHPSTYSIKLASGRYVNVGFEERRRVMRWVADA